MTLIIKKYSKLYVKFVTQYLKALMEYRVDFFIGLFAFIINQSLGFFLVFVIFQKIPSLNEWTLNQVLFIYAFSQIPRGIDHLLTDNLWILSSGLIVTGGFDKYLLRPINPLFHLLAEVFQTDALGEIIIGIALLIYSSITLNINFNLIDIFLLLLLIFCGTIIYTSVKLFFSSLSFWVKVSKDILYVNYSLSEFTKYPISIYGDSIKSLLTFIIPFAFTAYFPAGYFVGKVNIYFAVGGTVLAALISFAISYTIWSIGIRTYESAGN